MKAIRDDVGSNHESFHDSTANAAGIGSSDLFGDYDRAAERLSEARKILAIDPMHKPAQDRVEQMLRMVVFEIGRYLAKTRSPNSTGHARSENPKA